MSFRTWLTLIRNDSNSSLFIAWCFGAALVILHALLELSAASRFRADLVLRTLNGFSFPNSLGFFTSRSLMLSNIVHESCDATQHDIWWIPRFAKLYRPTCWAYVIDEDLFARLHQRTQQAQAKQMS